LFIINPFLVSGFPFSSEREEAYAALYADPLLSGRKFHFVFITLFDAGVNGPFLNSMETLLRMGPNLSVDCKLAVC